MGIARHNHLQSHLVCISQVTELPESKCQINKCNCSKVRSKFVCQAHMAKSCWAKLLVTTLVYGISLHKTDSSTAYQLLSSTNAVCMRAEKRTLETMPFVMLRESPPRGYPATRIESCRHHGFSGCIQHARANKAAIPAFITLQSNTRLMVDEMFWSAKV